MSEGQDVPVWDAENFVSGIEEWIDHLTGDAMADFLATRRGANEFYFFHREGIQHYNPGAETDPEEVMQQLSEMGERIPELLGIIHVRTICRVAPDTEEGLASLSSLFEGVDFYVDPDTDTIFIECIEISAIYGLGYRKAHSWPIVLHEDDVVEFPCVADLCRHEEEVGFDEHLTGFLSGRWTS
ncbi:hypothetical protein P4C99_17560 [Pontiellaceae bacterium B1224]|nr:hypothetical protein [Pontiellaceae bacterium B1224]